MNPFIIIASTSVEAYIKQSDRMEMCNNIVL